MDEDAQAGGQRYVCADRIVYASAGSIPTPAWRRPRPRHDTPTWVSDPHFTLRTATCSKRARVDATSDASVLGLPEVTASDVLQSECAICLQDWGADEETLRAMPCSHAFHQHCISNAPTPDHTPEEGDEEQEEEEEHEQEGGGEVEDWEWEDGAIGGESS
uniref:RING-type domain-containing protein n=1 Tax=Setaria viridis TaxID=4556 RepID=A0A4U6VDS9_SETVI|nr:hypothetical protein SEVIR_3G160100v2 [Setaria viridis]